MKIPSEQREAMLDQVAALFIGQPISILMAQDLLIIHWQLIESLVECVGEEMARQIVNLGFPLSGEKHE